MPDIKERAKAGILKPGIQSTVLKNHLGITPKDSNFVLLYIKKQRHDRFFSHAIVIKTL